MNELNKNESIEHFSLRHKRGTLNIYVRGVQEENGCRWLDAVEH